MDAVLPFFFLLIIIIALSIFLYYVPLGLWVTAFFSGVKVSIFKDLVGMRLRKVAPGPIIKALITASKAGLMISLNQLETHYLAGGNVQRVIQALISADKARLGLTFENATAIDLAGRDVFEAVQISVNPKVIETPPITALAKDGIQVRATARVTVRANLERLIGGAMEETILARVGEGIVTTIGSSIDHKSVLENPDNISKVVLSKGLDSGTAFEILSIDIADVDVGDNVGAALQADQANADLKVARAKAEERRAMAVALEQENRAKIEEMRAFVVAAEAEIPKAIAEAFRSGNLGVMDYYNMKNVLADTSMREKLAGSMSQAKKGKAGDDEQVAP
jgi:uncharacterized protein YqfA (UPF0365 family)